MKQVILLRHGKAESIYDFDDDFDRPLRKRGQNDAHLMGDLLATNDMVPDLIISSPAVRALETAQFVADQIDYPQTKIQEESLIYEGHFTTGSLVDLLKELPKEIERVMLVGHNPGVTQAAYQLLEDFFEVLPTCGMVGITFDVDSWQEISPREGTRLFFEYPKRHRLS